MKFNPDSTDLQEEYYYYFDLSYSNLALTEDYYYEIAMKIPPFKKGEYMTSLALCKDWEKAKIKEILKKASMPMRDVKIKN